MADNLVVGSDLSSEQLYLDLLKRCLTNVIYQDPPIPTPFGTHESFDLGARKLGLDLPSQAHTMVGFKRLENIQRLVEQVLADGVPGDFLEAGVSRGGAMVFLRGVLRAHRVSDRSVWLADSFEGFPEPQSDNRYNMREIFPELAPDGPDSSEAAAERRRVIAQLTAEFRRGTSEEEVRETFQRYGLLNGQVRFLPGWFTDTLPTAPVAQLAILRADSDLYDSTHTTLECLYSKVAPGGYVIIDDYLVIDECRQAVHDYLKRIDADDQEIEVIDECGVFWRKRR
jgi:hypothetical protein